MEIRSSSISTCEQDGSGREIGRSRPRLVAAGGFQGSHGRSNRPAHLTDNPSLVCRNARRESAREDLPKECLRKRAGRLVTPAGVKRAHRRHAALLLLAPPTSPPRPTAQ